ncbi:MAG: ATP-binding cassette domain-containing protein [Eubacteriales bacterium]
MNEVFEIADQVTVLRDGEVVGNHRIEDLTEKRLVELMVGKVLDKMFPKHDAKIGEVILKVEDLYSGKIVRGVSFELRKGEVLGLTGLLGSGRTETVRCIFGIDNLDRGKITICGQLKKVTNPRKASALIPENRKEQGLVLEMNVSENICLGASELNFIRNKRNEENLATHFMKAFSIKCSGIRQVTKYLSGGNQQKVVISKWVARKPKILILDEPTRGIDVSAKAEVYSMIGQMVQEGLAVLLISSEIEEIMGLCDRVVVLYEGKVTGEIHRRFLRRKNSFICPWL